LSLQIIAADAHGLSLHDAATIADIFIFARWFSEAVSIFPPMHKENASTHASIVGFSFSAASHKMCSKVPFLPSPEENRTTNRCAFYFEAPRWPMKACVFQGFCGCAKDFSSIPIGIGDYQNSLQFCLSQGH
jgi:hypothetical protein